MSGHTLRYLSRRDVESLNLPMDAVIEAVDEALREKGEGTAELPPKPGVHPGPDAFIHAMPAYLEGMGAVGLKWVSGFPQNLKEGLPYIGGLFILNDVRTGFPLSVMDCTWITGVRTGAATAVAARHLARPDSSTAGIVACGVQGRTNLEALACLFPLKRVHAYDIDRKRAEAFSRDLGGRLGLEIVPVGSAEEAVKGMDLVVTSGPIHKDPSPVIPAGWLAPGSFACALDFDSYWTGASMRAVTKLATDDRAQLSYYRTVGYFQKTPEPYADLGEIVTGRAPGRETPEERTMSLNLGLAIEDVATARLIYGRALESGVGTESALWAMLRGPKIRQIEDVTFFGKNPDSHALYLFRTGRLPGRRRKGGRTKTTSRSPKRGMPCSLTNGQRTEEAPSMSMSTLPKRSAGAPPGEAGRRVRVTLHVA